MHLCMCPRLREWGPVSKTSWPRPLTRRLGSWAPALLIPTFHKVWRGDTSQAGLPAEGSKAPRYPWCLSTGGQLSMWGEAGGTPASLECRNARVGDLTGLWASRFTPAPTSWALEPWGHSAKRCSRHWKSSLVAPKPMGLPLCPTVTLPILVFCFSVGKVSGIQRATASFSFLSEYGNISNKPHRHLCSYTCAF